MTETNPKQKIMEAIITCIEKYGIQKTTTWKIVEEAGYNTACMNYYFPTEVVIRNTEVNSGCFRYHPFQWL
jgi:AcrR family transcriptional regulator